jgi:ketosteroid isomerase-like protein
VSELTKTIQRLYDCWNEGDVDSAVAFLHDDVEYVNPDYAIEPGTRRGRGAVVKAMSGALEGAFDTYSHILHDVVPVADDRVLCLLTFRARGRDSGAQIEVAEQHLWTLRDGKVARLEWFHDERAARRAAGLNE